MSLVREFRTLVDRVNEPLRAIATYLERLDAALATLDGGAAPPEAQPVINAPPVDRPPAPTLDRTPSGLVGETPRFREGYVDPLVWRAAREEAPKNGVRPETLVAIQVWESAWYTSRLFQTANNVGGIKYRPDLINLGHNHGSYKAKDGNVYAAFPNWREGVAAHARFLSQRRYDRVRQTEDVTEEVRAIHDAGYAEHSMDWLEGVTALARRFEKEQA